MSEDQTKTAPPGWWEDTLEGWQRLPNKVFFFSLLLAWLALFQFWGNSILGYVKTPSLFGWLIYGYTLEGSDDRFGALVPFIVVGLCWWKRRELLAVPFQPWPPALAGVAAALFLHVVGFISQQPRLSVIALFLGIFGIMGVVWGRAWLKAIFFPFWLFLFCVPVSSLTTFITFPLRMLVTWLAAVTANLMTFHVHREGTRLISPDGSYQYSVEAECSGIHSLIAIFLLATVYAFVAFRSPWKRALLMALALPLSVLGNFLRLMFIVVAAEFGGQSAGDYVHGSTVISLLPYVPVLAGLLLAGRWLERREEREETTPPPTPTA